MRFMKRELKDLKNCLKMQKVLQNQNIDIDQTETVMSQGIRNTREKGKGGKEEEGGKQGLKDLRISSWYDSKDTLKLCATLELKMLIFTSNYACNLFYSFFNVATL